MNFFILIIILCQGRGSSLRLSHGYSKEFAKLPKSSHFPLGDKTHSQRRLRNCKSQFTIPLSASPTVLQCSMTLLRSLLSYCSILLIYLSALIVPLTGCRGSHCDSRLLPNLNSFPSCLLVILLCLKCLTAPPWCSNFLLFLAP